MSVDDVPVLRIGTEFLKNPRGAFLGIAQGVVLVAFFLVCALVGNEITLEGCHTLLAEQR